MRFRDPSYIGLISILILLICRQSVVFAEEQDEATGVGEASHEETHNDHDVSAEVAVSGEHASHDELQHPIVKGHGEPCGGEDGGHCDKNLGLMCFDEKCECDSEKSETWKDGKCEVAVVPEVENTLWDSESLETGGGIFDAHAGDTHSEHHGHGHHEHHHEMHEEVTTTSTTPAPVPVHDPVEEKEEKEEEKEAEEPVVEVQHVSSETHEHNHDESSVVEEHNHEHHADEHTDHQTDEHNHQEPDQVDHEHVHPVVIGSEGKCANVNCVETLGHYSKCDEETGECKCSDVDGSDRPTILIDSRCHIHRKINSSCTKHEECSATISGPAWCHMDVVTNVKFCTCEQFHYYDETLAECLPFARDGIKSKCKTDLQCTGIEKKVSGHGFGPNAQCNAEGVCECKLGPNGQKAFLYQNYCYYQLMPEDSCTFEKECQVSFPGQDVTCTEEVCLCRSGENITAVSCPLDPNDASNLPGESRLFDDEKIQSSGLDLSSFVYIMIIGAVVLLALVVLSILIVKKRHKYSVVKTREPNKDEPDSPL